MGLASLAIWNLTPIEYLDAYEGNAKLKADWSRILTHKPKRILYAHANEKEMPQ